MHVCGANGVTLGAKSLVQARKAMRSLAKLLNMKLVSSQVRNIVVSENLGCKIDVRNLYTHLRKENPTACCEDELFSGITWKADAATVRLFQTGKFIVTGLKSIKQARVASKSVSRI